MVAKTLLKAMPISVQHRLIDSESYSSLADLSVLRYQDIGSIRHGDILSALNEAKISGGDAHLVARNGTRLTVRRLPNQEGSVLCFADSTDRLIPEFSFLDPEKEVRLSALENAEKQCWPELVSVENWRSLLTQRPLSELELSHLILSIRETPSQFLTLLKHKWQAGGEIGHEDVFARSSAYYSALVGPRPGGSSAEDWINLVLVPDLVRGIRFSLIGGLKRALALNVDPRLSPVRVVKDIPDDELLPALLQHMQSGSPIVLLGILEIALSRVNGNSGFAELVGEALGLLVGEKSKSRGINQAWTVIPTLVKASLRKISSAQDMCAQPPFWRRLAAYAHANVVAESLDLDDENIPQFTAWIGGLETDSDAAASLLDMKEEPLWRTWDLTERHFRAFVIGRLAMLRTSLDGLELGGHVDLATDALKSDGGLLHLEKPGPLTDVGLRMSDLAKLEVAEPSEVADFFSQTISELATQPTGIAWKGMAATCRLLRFDQALLENLAQVVHRFSLPLDDGDRQLFFEALLYAADVAATQPCDQLADAVVAALIRTAGKFSGPSEVAVGYRIIFIASGAIKDRELWRGWIGKRMSDYAFCIPMGISCRKLFDDLDTLQTMLPLHQRCFGQAKKYAAAGMSGAAVQKPI